MVETVKADDKGSIWSWIVFAGWFLPVFFILSCTEKSERVGFDLHARGMPIRGDSYLVALEALRVGIALFLWRIWPTGIVGIVASLPWSYRAVVTVLRRLSLSST